MAKVLLVDTNFSSAPIYQELLAAGHEVHVVGGNPADCLAKVAKHYWGLDYSDIDALSSLVDGQGFDFLVPGCTDRSYESCVVVGRGRFPGFDLPDVARTLGHKAHFRVIAERLGLPVPRTHRCNSHPGNGSVIVKPVDAFSGKGITVLGEAEPSGFQQAVHEARLASPSGACLVEDFVEGQLYSHSAFLRGTRVVKDFLVQEDGSANPFVVDTSRVLGEQAEGLLHTLRAHIERLAADLQLSDGLLHTQFISNGVDVWLIEITRRCPGDLYSQLIAMATGFPYARSYIAPFLGAPVEAFGSRVSQQTIMRHTITVPAGQSLDHVRFLRNLHIERLVPLSLVGDQLKPSPFSRIAVLFCRTADAQTLEDLYQATLRRDLYVVSDGRVSN